MPGGPLFVTRFPTPHAFLEGAGQFLEANEVENNLILGVSRNLALDSSGLIRDPYFAAVCRGNEVRMVAFQTLPGRMAISREAEPDAVRALSRDAHEASLVIDAVLGPDPTVERFATDLAALRGQRTELRMRQRIHELTTVVAPSRRPAGRLRLAVESDTSRVAEWLAAFQVEIGEPAPTNRAATYRIGAKELFLWDDGQPRSMAGWSGPTTHGIRVNAVYTPPQLRGQGYASMTVAALSQLLLDRGYRFCCLYTDLANPTSNAIYKRIGYEPISDSSVYRLVSSEQ
ncbi:MAG TPA: GNAT family N-acetyltransferase [Gemmatimonadales bacterium]|nr:GNAT family N-acetyltransferase [Gemmatimonadales bacterium]